MSEPRSFPASRTALTAYWQVFADIGPRHKNVARWLHVFGWTIDPEAARAYLAPEMKR